MKKPAVSKTLSTYVALLRGINVGGNAAVKMSDLKTHFEKMGFVNVKTYINSGNVIFQSSKRDGQALGKIIEAMLADNYSFRPKVVVRDLAEMLRVNNSVPKTWGKGPEKKYNVLFLREAIDSKDIVKGLKPKKGIEEVAYRPGVLYWSALTSDLTRSSMIKLSAEKIYQEMTIRNWNTTRKVLEIMENVAGR